MHAREGVANLLRHLSCNVCLRFSNRVEDEAVRLSASVCRRGFLCSQHVNTGLCGGYCGQEFLLLMSKALHAVLDQGFQLFCGSEVLFRAMKLLILCEDLRMDVGELLVHLVKLRGQMGLGTCLFIFLTVP